MSRRPREVTIQPEETSASVAVSSSALQIAGDLAIAAGAHVHESLEVAGDARVGRDARLDDSLRVLGDLHVGDNARMGAVDADGSVQWGDRAEATRFASRGPLALADGRTLATAVVARRGIHAGVPSRQEGA